MEPRDLGDEFFRCQYIDESKTEEENIQAKENLDQDGPPLSPNLQTRHRRSYGGNSIASSYNERERVARLCREFRKKTTKPCSVFGYDRYQRFRGGFFFCSNCKDADDKERDSSVRVNRTTKGGPYTCMAEHESIIYPTDRIKIEIKKPHTRTNLGKPTKKKAPPDSNRKRKDPPNKEDSTSSKARKTEATAESETYSCFESSDEEPERTTGVEPQHSAKQRTNDNEPRHGVQQITPDRPDQGVNNPPPPTEEPASICQQWQSSSTDNTTVEALLQNQETIKDLQQQIEALSKKKHKMRESFKKQQKTIKKHLNEIGTLQRRVQTLEAKHGKIPSSCSSETNAKKLVSHIKSVIVEAVRNHSGNSQRAKAFFAKIARMLLDEPIHNHQLSECLVRIVQRHLRKTVFTPFNILREMDMAGGKLNYAGIEVLRVVECGGKPKRKHTMIPSTSAIQRCAQYIEQFAEYVVPFHPIRNPKDGAEGFYFRAADVFVAILKAANMLDGEARTRAIQFAQSLDGATLSKSLSHVLGGLKFNDKSSPLKAQSRDMVFPPVCVIGRENKALVRGLFSRMIREIREAANKVLPTMYAIMALKIITNCDMSVEWKLSGKGGATKNAEFPCAKCTVRSGALHTEANDPLKCKWCLHQGYVDEDTDPDDVDVICYHAPMCTDEHMAKMNDQVKTFEDAMPEISKEIGTIWNDSKISISKAIDPRAPPTKAQRTKDLSSIHFDISKATQAKRRAYSTNLNNDLELRGLELSGSLASRQRRLKLQLISEWTYVDASTTVNRFGKASITSALVMLMDTIPCLLHMEMRMGIKILSMCLKDGLTRSKNNELKWIDEKHFGNMANKCNAFVVGIEKVLNTEILGSETMPFQETLPLDKKTHTMGEIKMDNTKIRKILAKMDKIVDLCIIKEDDKTRWLSLLVDYQQAMTILLKKEDLSNTEIYEYQRLADSFFKEWVILYGEEGITNYAHLIGSAHIGEYLLHWRSLYSHSQQGWEAFNSLFKSFFYSRTQRGGSVNQGRGPRSRLLPMAKWLQRRLIFIMGHTMESIKAELENLTELDKEKHRNWVRDCYGTIEFGQVIRNPIPCPDETKDSGEQDNADMATSTAGMESVVEGNVEEEVHRLATTMLQAQSGNDNVLSEQQNDDGSDESIGDGESHGGYTEETGLFDWDVGTLELYGKEGEGKGSDADEMSETTNDSDGDWL